MTLDTQPDTRHRHTAGEEDCLYLNVYSPLDPASSIAPASPLPVMVWIYGGGYSVGSATWADYGPQKFLDTDQVPSSVDNLLLKCKISRSRCCWSPSTTAWAPWAGYPSARARRACWVTLASHDIMT